MDGTTTSFSSLFLPLGVLASVVAWNLARRRGLNERRWAIVCFLFFPALVALAFAKPRRRAGDTDAFRERWAALAAYDPDIKPAIERLATLGPAAVEQFRLAYAAVQTKEAIPLILADVDARWAAGDRFDGTFERSERLATLHREGRLSDREYAAQSQRLQAQPARGPWAGWWWKAPLLLAAVWLVWPKSTLAGFPTCEADATRSLVRQAIENGPDAKTVNNRLLALDEIRQLSEDPKGLHRYCMGRATLNGGERRIVWYLYQRGSNVFVDVSGL